VTNEPLLEGDFLDRAGYVLGNFGGRDNAGAILIALSRRKRSERW
jgi:hypothetical protein